MKKIYFDLDDVLYDFSYALYNELVIHWNYQGTYESFWTMDYLNHGFDSLWWENMIRIPTIYSVLVPRKEDLVLLNEISKHYEVYYITSRPKELESVTRWYLSTYDYPDWDKENRLIFTKKKDLYCNSLGIEIAVEDMKHNIISLCESGVEVIIMDKFWNQGIPGKRIYDIQQLGAILL